MVQVINLPKGYKDKSVRRNEAIGQALQMGTQLVGEYAENKALKDNYGVDLTGIQDPQTRQQILAQELQMGRKRRAAEQSQGLNYPLSADDTQNKSQKLAGTPQNDQRLQERQDFLNEMQRPQKKSVDFMQNGEKPSRRGMQQPSQNQQQIAQEQPRQIQDTTPNFPQPEATTGKIPRMTPQQQLEEAKKRSAQSQNTDNPQTVMQALEEMVYLDRMSENYNATVEADTQQKVKAQERYGQIAAEQLGAVQPNASPEVQAWFQRKGEQIAQDPKMSSEADFKKKMAQEAKQYGNTIQNVKDSIGPARLGDKTIRQVMGNDIKAETQRNNLRILLDPLLKDGLYDTVRNVLSENGFYPEERETILSSLGEGSKKALAALPDFNKSVGGKTGFGGSKFLQDLEKSIIPSAPLTEQQQEQVYSNLSNALQQDPAANLILLRKAYMDKGVPWDVFNEGIVKAIMNKTLITTPEQQAMLGDIMKPPTAGLETIMHGLNLIGK